MMDLFAQQGGDNPVYYAQSSAQAYQWMERDYPNIFAGIRQRVQEGRWEIVGGMWVESDAELPSGESFCRQFLSAQWYFFDKFGVMAKIGWLPDSFGFNGNLPQFHRRSGIDKFFLYKLNWNDTHPPQHNLFYWYGPDGSKLLVHLAYDQYNNRASAAEVWNAVNTKRAHEPNQPTVFFPIGTGDHGGGIVMSNITRLQALQNDGYHIHFGRVEDFFNSIDQRQINTTVSNDELYFERHRGTYTSRALHKKNMRELEYKLQDAEIFASLANLLGRPYPWADLDGAWKRLMRDQFHDVMSGTAIEKVYVDEVGPNLAQVRQVGDDTLDGSLGFLADRVNTAAAAQGQVFLVFNPNAFESSEPMVLAGADAEHHVLNGRGETVPCQYSPVEQGLIFVAEDIPPWGWRTYQLAAGAPAGQAAFPATPQSLENEQVKVGIDSAGYVTSILNKDLALEFIKPGERANLLQLYPDHPLPYDAWDLGFDKYTQAPTVVEDTQSVQVVEDGPVRQVVEVARQGQVESYVQRIVLYAGRDTVDFETLVRGWGNPAHRFLKVAFPTTISNPRKEVRNNMPYGSLVRVLDGHRADTEFVGHKWVDLSETHLGVAPSAAGFTLFNREKYGYDVANDGPGQGLSDGACNILRLSLLKSGTSPQWEVPDSGGPVTDRGDFLTHYRVYPHAGDVRPAALYRRAEAFANPLLVHFSDAHPGALPETGQLLSFASELGGVLATTLKRPDRNAQDHELILRLVEIDGAAARVALDHSAWSVLTARHADILERVTGGELAANDGFEISLAPGAIETVRLSLGEPLASDDDGANDDIGDDDASDDDAAFANTRENSTSGCCGS